MGPKSTKNRPNIDQKSIQNSLIFGSSFFLIFGPSWLDLGAKLAQLGPQLTPSGSNLDQLSPKMVPSWVQVGTKLGQVGASWPQDGIKWPYLAKLPDIAKTLKNKWLFNDFEGWRLPRWTKNRPNWTKLAPSWHQNPKKWGSKMISKKVIIKKVAGNFD
mgnify:CR=1 FL=1